MKPAIAPGNSFVLEYHPPLPLCAESAIHVPLHPSPHIGELTQDREPAISAGLDNQPRMRLYHSGCGGVILSVAKSHRDGPQRIHSLCGVALEDVEPCTAGCMVSTASVMPVVQIEIRVGNTLATASRFQGKP